MEISSQEDHDIPIPINSTYGGGHGHMIHHHHHDAAHATSAPPTHNNSNNPQMPSNGSNNNGHGHGNHEHHHQHDHHEDNRHHHHHVGGCNSINYKKQQVGAVKYKECLKNHAASMGGNATDGCGEFMPSGVEGSIEALTCSACNCHRNFHRKEVEGGELMLFHHHHQPPPPPPPPPPSRKLMLTHHPHKIRSAVPHQMIMPTYMGIGVGGSHQYMPNSESEDQIDQEDGGAGLVLARPVHHQPFQKKRFRTKFTQEQKEKMLSFAERVGWKIQRQEESVVQQFCQEIGVKRRVLKVWMHNNKHNLAKKNDNVNLSGNNNNNATTTATGNLASSA